MCQRKWNIGRDGHRWTDEKIQQYLSTRPTKADWMTGLDKDAELYSLVGLVLENLGIDRVVRFGKLEDWKAAIAAVEDKNADTPMAHMDEVMADDDAADPHFESYQKYASGN